MNPIAYFLIVIGLTLTATAVAADVSRQRRLTDFLRNTEAGPRRPLPRRGAPDLIADASLLVCLGVTVGVGAAAFALSRAGATAIVLAAVAAVVSFGMRSSRRRRHRDILRTQFADSIASLASSMSAGNSFLRSFQQLEITSVPPLRPHLAHTLNEVDLGEPVSIAVESMARRTQLVEAAWLAHVLRVQELTGSPIAGLLQELAALVRQTDSLQREIRTLTAEGRISAYVIAALPLALAAVLSLSNPGYLDTFSQGWGLVATLGMVVAILGGLLIMSLMVRSVEV